MQDAIDYFSGAKIVQVDRGGYQEPVTVPKASADAVQKGVSDAIENGSIWLLAGPASILGEPVPAGVLTATATLLAPPTPIGSAEILPENLPAAWTGEETNALAVATTLSTKAGKTLPWKTVRDAIGSSLQARFTELADGSGTWPCEFPAAKSVRLKVAAGKPDEGDGGSGGGGKPTPKKLTATAAMEPSEVQDLADAMSKLLDIKAKTKVPITFTVRIELGDGQEVPSSDVADQVNAVLSEIRDDLRVE